MDGTTGRPDGAGSYFWLRHAMQVTVGEHMHTIEMSVPIPIGASAEVRERLLREAEAGMHQLANHVEGRAAQWQQSNLSSASTTPAPKPPLRPAPAPAPPSLSPASAPTAMRHVGRQGDSLSPGQGPRSGGQADQPGRLIITGNSEAPEPKSNEVTVPPTRPNVGASMPSTPGDTHESLKLPQFIQAIKDTLGLTPKQAMELLNVKTLSGLNLREALEQLQQLVAGDGGRQGDSLPPGQGPRSGGQVDQPGGLIITGNSEAPEPKQTSPSTPGQKLRIVGGQAEARGNDKEPQERPTKPGANTPPTVASASPTRPVPGLTGASPSPGMPPAAVPGPKVPGIKEITHAVVRENPPAFDEEIDLDDLEIDLAEEEMEYLPELTDQERAIAEHVLNRLKEARGSSAASELRLKVLHNVLNEQISGEQLQQLIQSVWGAATLKKLKNDQVEALISWAKEDDFVGEAEMVLAVLQEEQYARSDR